MSDRPHGYARYRLDGCRCYTCGYARSQYDENRTKAITAGTWQPYVDAAPVRTHIRSLQECGMGLRTIATLTGVERQRLQSITSGRPERGTGPQSRIRPAAAEAILRVEPTLENLAPGTKVHAAGTHRRMQALVLAGWPQHQLAVRLGMTDPNFSAMLRGSHVTARRALTVRSLYDALWNADPRKHGVDTQACSRASNHAARNDWVPVGAWDDDTIDDPAAAPWTAAEEPALNRDALAAVRREEIGHLISFGFAEEEIAQRLGMALSTVHSIVLEIRTGQRRERPPQGEPKCGEARMYRRHLARGETPCDACRAANAAADRRYRLTGSQKAA
ncbi:hypothetical protein [Streptomyces sp. UH6]|uniref:hypothetical protein n=1 Tax=Streptomyces sp. UH6 TaxID=2748379 RepID=UPI0015D483EF|nr:hypothetical protein [Streptomyces sp. UH6]NYV73116.1 hypothetical protein [Streptomyces sp. UH6]